MSWTEKLAALTEKRGACTVANQALETEVARVFPPGEMVEYSDAPNRADRPNYGTVIRVVGTRVWVRSHESGKTRVLDAGWRVFSGRLRVAETEPDRGDVDASGGGD